MLRLLRVRDVGVRARRHRATAQHRSHGPVGEAGPHLVPAPGRSRILGTDRRSISCRVRDYLVPNDLRRAAFRYPDRLAPVGAGLGSVRVLPRYLTSGKLSLAKAPNASRAAAS